MGAAAPALAPLLQACGGSNRPLRRPTTPPRPLPEIRGQLRALVEDLGARYPEVSALATMTHRGGAAVDATERGANRTKSAAVMLSVFDGTTRFERATTDLRASGITRLVDDLEVSARATSTVPRTMAAPVDYATRTEIDPQSHSPEQWLEAVGELYHRARRVGGSRVVYRGAYLTVDDTRTVYIDRNRDLGQRIVRTRGGVLLVAWTGAAPTADDASRSGTIGLEALAVPGDALEAAAERALSLLTARPAPSGPREVVIDPTVSAMIASDCVGAALTADRWRCGETAAATYLAGAADHRLATPEVTLIDDPSATGGYGSYFFDDEGQPASPTRLIDAGVLRGPITDAANAAALRLATTANGRRITPLDPVRPRLSNIAFGAGSLAGREELLAGVEDGLLIEGAMGARADLRTLRFAVRAARAREIRHGKLTGALYGTIDLHADVPGFLGGVRGATREVSRFPASPDGLAMSMGGPFLLSRCEVTGG